MNVGLVQTNPQEDVEENLAEISDAVTNLAKSGADVVVLPEMFAFMGEDSGRWVHSDPLGKGVFARLSALATETGVYLVSGSHGERTSEAPGSRVYNTHVTYDPDGASIFCYRKVHLFNLRSRSGETEFRESDVFLPGSVPQEPFEILCRKGDNETVSGTPHAFESWKAATLICYDLRFPEIFRLNPWRDQPPAIFFLPAAFTHRTGEAHWEVLLRARAIENQCYIVACNQVGRFCHGRKRNYGHSMVVSPWGEVIRDLGDAPAQALVDIDLAAVEQARQQIPSLDNRVL